MPQKLEPRSGYIAYVALIFGIMSIGISAIFVRLANAPGIISSFYRMAIGATLMVVPFFYRIRCSPNSFEPKGVFSAILGGFFFSVDMALWSTGVEKSGATIPTLLANTAPIWVALGSWLILRESQSYRFWLGLVIAFLGAAIILGFDLVISFKFDQGAVYGLLAAVFYGGYHLASQKGRVYLNTLSYFWLSTSSAAIFLLFYVLLFRQPLTGYTPQTWVLFFGMGVVVQVLGWILINYSHGHIPAALVSLTLLAQPLMTGIFAVILLGERLTFWSITGGFMVILGVYLVHRSRRE